MGRALTIGRKSSRGARWRFTKLGARSSLEAVTIAARDQSSREAISVARRNRRDEIERGMASVVVPRFRSVLFRFGLMMGEAIDAELVEASLPAGTDGAQTPA
jgi:hypothetical protein